MLKLLTNIYSYVNLILEKINKKLSATLVLYYERVMIAPCFDKGLFV